MRIYTRKHNIGITIPMIEIRKLHIVIHYSISISGFSGTRDMARLHFHGSVESRGISTTEECDSY